jgi:hypothetical protein
VVDPANSCLNAREFLDQVRRRTPRARAAEPGESARRFIVTLENHGRVVGRLLTENTDGTTAVREVQGTSCQEVADALALVVAVTLDPFADQSPTSGNERMYGRPSARPSSGLPRALPPTRAVRVPTQPEPKARWEHALGAEATLRAWLVDQPMPALGARYWGSLAREDAPGVLFTVGAFATRAADAQAVSPANDPHRYADGVIRYHLYALDATVCPLGARLGALVRLYPCGALTVGQLEAEAIGLRGVQSDKDAALFVAAALEGRWMIRLGGPLRLAGSAGLSVPLQKKDSVVATAEGNERSVGSTKPVGFVGALGLVLSTR